jgi:hypothetical protein
MNDKVSGFSHRKLNIIFVNWYKTIIENIGFEYCKNEFPCPLPWIQTGWSSQVQASWMTIRPRGEVCFSNTSGMASTFQGSNDGRGYFAMHSSLSSIPETENCCPFFGEDLVS